MTYLVVAAFLIAVILNVKAGLNNQFVDFSNIAFASENVPPSGQKVKYCRLVGCSDLWEGTADAQGCITIYTKKYCGWKGSIHVEYTYFGKNENCTGGNEWYDCDACQKDCVPES